MSIYTQPEPWDVIWKRPYSKYEKHHQIFWNLIREKAKGKILDLACGSASCWRGLDRDLHLVDFSAEAITQAQKNFPSGKFLLDDLPTYYYDGDNFDTVVMCGLVNYYENLTPFMEMVKRCTHKDSLVLITINVINDFPGREWTKERIQKEFGSYGDLKSAFYDKIGWFIELTMK